MDCRELRYQRGRGHIELEPSGGSSPGHARSARALGGKHEELDAFFDVLESLIVRGYHRIRGLAVYGIIEDIQNVASHRPHRFQVFEPWLRPTSKKAWHEIEAIWQGHPGLADMVRAERQGEVPIVSAVLQMNSP